MDEKYNIQDRDRVGPRMVNGVYHRGDILDIAIRYCNSDPCTEDEAHLLMQYVEEVVRPQIGMPEELGPMDYGRFASYIVASEYTARTFWDRPEA